MLPFILFRNPPSIFSLALSPPLLRELPFPALFTILLSSQPTAFSTPWSTRFSLFFSANREGNGMMHASTHTRTHTTEIGVSLMQGKKCNNYNTNDPIQPAPFPSCRRSTVFHPSFSLYCYWCCCLCLCLLILWYYLCSFPFCACKCVCLWEHKEKKNGSWYYEKNFFSLFNKHRAQTKPKTMRVFRLLVKIF